MFECRIHGRRLQNRAVKLLHGVFQFGQRHCHHVLGEYLALAVARVRGNPQLDHRIVGFIGVSGILRELGRFAQTQWQQSARERIQNTGMPGLSCAK